SQALDLPPQWYPQDWEVTASANGKTLRLETAQPTAGETRPGGLDVEAAWVGLGTETDFAGRDVRGKAVFIHAVPLPSVWRHSANVWGELPGTSDERIIILAHRDGYFDAASDNASGVATTLGLAEYFARIPKERRRRTIQFIGTPGHHGNVGLLGARWLLQNKETALAKTALLI